MHNQSITCYTLIIKSMFNKKINLFDSLTKTKKILSPINKNIVKIYSCGPTLYKKSHIGNLRGYVFADTLNRILKESGYRVKHVINLTDVGHLVSDGDYGEDKIEKEAKETNKNIEELITDLIRIFNLDLKSLQIPLERYYFTRATKYIKEQIQLIQRLEKKEFAYKISDGVYFDTKKFKNYGMLAGLNTSKQEEGKRVKINSEKKDLHDFALWKFSTKKEDRLQEWDSPWGVGFPGWHTECCAMASSVLGESIDIHTGGIDLAPTHHNNEIAQQESDTGKTFVNIWMHTEHLGLDGNKLSKSEGSGIYLDDLAKHNINPISLRYLFLTIHYRTPINYTEKSIKAASLALKELESFCFYKGTLLFTKTDKKIINKIKEIIADDISTPQAIAALWDFLKDNSKKRSVKTKTLLELDKTFGLGLKKRKIKIPKKINYLVSQRNKLRKQKKLFHQQIIINLYLEIHRFLFQCQKYQNLLS